MEIGPSQKLTLSTLCSGELKKGEKNQNQESFMPSDTDQNWHMEQKKLSFNNVWLNYRPEENRPFPKSFQFRKSRSPNMQTTLNQYLR